MTRIFMAALMIAVAVAGLAVMFNTGSGPLPYAPTNLGQKVIHVGDVPIRVEVADTPELWARGLSGTEEKPPRSLLFVFDRDDTWGIWMKDMKYPIDVLWIMEAGEIVHIEEHLLPSSYPRVYRPTVPVRYVLELPAGYVEQFNLRREDVVTF